MIKKSLPTRLSLLLTVITMCLSTTVNATEEAAPPVVLLELYTSQGCYSCPPAEALLRDDYAQRSDVMAIELHVDYWNDLVYGSAGAWTDPFSKKAYTQRQSAYNRNLLQSGSIYTPQMIIQGRHQSSGAKKGQIDNFIEQQLEQQQSLRFYFDGNITDGLTARLDGPLSGSANFFYAVYWLQKSTPIPSGENKGKILVSRHVVKTLESQPANRRQLSLPVFNPQEEGCAIWIQRPSTGAILAAARCPANNVTLSLK